MLAPSFLKNTMTKKGLAKDILFQSRHLYTIREKFPNTSVQKLTSASDLRGDGLRESTTRPFGEAVFGTGELSL